MNIQIKISTIRNSAGRRLEAKFEEYVEGHGKRITHLQSGVFVPDEQVQSFIPQKDREQAIESNFFFHIGELLKQEWNKRQSQLKPESQSGT